MKSSLNFCLQFVLIYRVTGVALNINSILQPLENCLVILLHFPENSSTELNNINFVPGVPTIQSVVSIRRDPYEWSKNITHSMTYFTPNATLYLPFAKIYPPFICAVSLYLFPSVRKQIGGLNVPLLTDWYLTSPPPLWRFKRLHTDAISPYLNLENIFRILVTNSESTLAWDNWAVPIFQWNRGNSVHPSQMFIIEVSRNPAKFEDLKIYLVCEMCTPCYMEYFEYYGELNLALIRQAFKILQKTPLQNRPWRFQHTVLNINQVAKYNGQRSQYFGNITKNDKSIPLLVEFILIRLTFPNITITGLEIDCENEVQPRPKNSNFAKTHSQLVFLPEIDPKIDPRSNIPLVLMGMFSFPYFSLKIEGLEFVTCYPIQNSKPWEDSFSALFGSLDWISWFLISVSAVSISAVMAASHKIITSMKSTCKDHRQFFLLTLFHLGYATLLEQSNPYAKNEKASTSGANRDTYKFTYILCTIWILTAIVLTHSYRSEYVKSFTIRPNPPKFTDFAQLYSRNFTIYSGAYDVTLFKYLSNIEHFFDCSVSAILPKVFYSIFYDQNLYPGSSQSDIYNPNADSEKLKRLGEVARFPKNYGNILNGNDTFARTVDNCEIRTAFAGWSDDVEEIYHELKVLRKDSTVSRSVHPLTPIQKGWAVHNVPDASILDRLGSLITSGLGAKWSREVKNARVRISKNLSRKAENAKQPWRKLDLRNNFVGIFFVWIFASVVSLVVIFCEVVTKRKVKLQVCIHKVV